MNKQNRKEYWKEQYTAYLQSGLTQREYCKQNDINYWSFNHWKRKFEKSESDIAMQELTLKLSDEIIQPEYIEIIISNTIRISIPDAFSPDTLKKIISIFEGKQ